MSTTEHNVDFAAVKASVPWETFLQYAEAPGITRRHPNKLRGPCPFCKAPKEFSVTEDAGQDKRGLFNCFRCETGGDMLEFLSLRRGNKPKDRKGWYAAAAELQQRFGGVQNGTVRAERTVQNSTPGLQEGPNLQRIAESLKPEHEGLAPFGLELETYRHFGAGWKGAGSLANSLAIPIHSADGALKGFCGISPKDGTIAFPKDFPRQQHVFNAHRIEPGSEVTVASDVLSVLRAFEGGESNVVAFLSEAVSGEYLELFVGLLDAKGCVWLP